MEHSKLSDHKFSKGKFTTPFNEIVDEIEAENSWFYGRLPEYIWLIIIIDKYGHIEGLNICLKILHRLHEINPLLESIELSIILQMSENQQNDLFNYIKINTSNNIFESLTVIFTYNNYPVFINNFYTSKNIKKRAELVESILSKASNHQSEIATDVRYLVLFFKSLIQKLVLPKEMIISLNEYPYIPHSEIRMRKIRPEIRAAELMILTFNKNDFKKKYLALFWGVVSKVSECKLYKVNFGIDNSDKSEYISSIKNSLSFYCELFTSTYPLDNKMLVLLSQTTYSFKRLSELVEHNLYNSISGRNTVRVMAENLIMMKFLLMHEKGKTDIWKEFQYYGIGKYKLIYERYLEYGKEIPNSHIPFSYLDALVNEYKDKEFIDMDTSYFDKKSIREKAMLVQEKELYDLYYEYDTVFEHGLWGAIRESSLLKCDNSAHQYHCVPDIEGAQALSNVWFDCQKIMNSTINIIESIYGSNRILDKEMSF